MRNMSCTPFLLVFLRTYLVGAAFNMRGLQNVGFIYAMEPALSSIHKDPASLHKARSRYVRHYNCHPYWTPLVAGMLLHTEMKIADGRMTPDSLGAIKDTAVNTLSALGDSVFGGTLLVTWVIAMAALLISGYEELALLGSIALFLALQLFKLITFAAGVRFGLETLFWLRRWDLINWGDKLKICNAFLLLFFLALSLPVRETPALWGLAIVAIVLGAWLTARLHVPRSLLALLAASAVVFLT